MDGYLGVKLRTGMVEPKGAEAEWKKPQRLKSEDVDLSLASDL